MGVLKAAEIKPVETVKEVEIKEMDMEVTVQGKLAPYRSVPLSKDLKEYIIDTAEDCEISPALVFAVIETESNFDPDTVSPTGDYGLMQLNSTYESMWRDKYGVYDLMDPYQNVMGGIKHLGELKEQYQHDNLVLIAYNMGEGGAEFAWSEGQWTSGYTDRVQKLMEQY